MRLLLENFRCVAKTAKQTSACSFQMPMKTFVYQDWFLIPFHRVQCSHFPARPFASRMCYSQGCSRLLIRSVKERRENGEQNAKRRWEGWRERKEEGKVGMTEDRDREEDKKKRREWSWRELRGREPFHVSCKCDFEGQISHYLPPCLCVFMHYHLYEIGFCAFTVFPKIRLVTGPGDNCLYLRRHLVCPSFTINFEILKTNKQTKTFTAEGHCTQFQQL